MVQYSFEPHSKQFVCMCIYYNKIVSNGTILICITILSLNSHFFSYSFMRFFFPLSHPHTSDGEKGSVQFSSVQSLSHVQLFATPQTTALQASLSITNSQSLLKLMSMELVMPSSHLILCHPLLLLPSIFPSIRVFSSESVYHIRQPKYWSFSFSISHSNEYSGPGSFRTDWFDFLAVQGTLKSLLQNHS